MLDRLRNMPRKLKTTAGLWLGEEVVILRWATEGVVAQNWGDKLNPYLAEKITGIRAIHRQDIYPIPRRPIHYWIGSHLSTALADPDAVVWGAGFISADVPISGRPAALYAVRGWLSVEKLKREGSEAPDVVGDAALLLPRFHQPKPSSKKYQIGVIPHCFEWNEPFFRAAQQWNNALMIDITGEIEDVVDQIVSCEKIISSSLHGIICADSYGIPSLWLYVSDKPKGDGFKFRDYFSSVGRPDWHPIHVDRNTIRSEIESKFFEYTIDIDLDILWNACPMRPEGE